MIDDEYSPQVDTLPPQIGSVLMDTAKKMAVFGVLMMAGKAGTKVLSNVAGKTIKTYASGTRLGKIANDIFYRGETPTLGAILKDTGPGKTLSKMAGDHFTGVRSSLDYRQNLIKAATLQNPARAAITRVTSSFRDLSTFSGTFAGAWKKTVWGGAGAAYAIDSALGWNKDYLKQKPLYDIPGQVGNFGKWLAYNTAFGMPFAAAGPLAKAAGGALELGLSKVFQGSLGKKVVNAVTGLAQGTPWRDPRAKELFNEKTLKAAEQTYSRSQHEKHFVARAIRSGMAFADSVGGMFRTVNADFRQMGQHVKTANQNYTGLINRVKHGVVNPVITALKNAKEIWSNAKKNTGMSWSTYTTPGLKSVEMIQQIVENVPKWKASGKQHTGLTAMLGAFGGEWQKSSKETTLIQRIFGIEPLRNKDVLKATEVKKWYGVLGNYFPKDQSEQLISHVLNMKVGLHSYKAHGSEIKGANVNLSFLDPVSSIKRAISTVISKPFHIIGTGLNLDIGSLTHAHTLLSESPSFNFFQRTPNFTTGSRDVKAGTTPIGVPTSVGQLIDPDGVAFYANGKFGIINAGEAFSLDTGHRLKYSTRHGAFKENEHKIINKDKYNRMAVASNERTSKKNIDRFGPIFGGMINSAKLSLPGVAKQFLGWMDQTLQGKNRAYIHSVQNEFGDTINDRSWLLSAPVLGSLKQHIEQELLPVFKKKEALQVSADASLIRNFGDAWDVMSGLRRLTEVASTFRVQDRIRSKGLTSIDDAIAALEVDPSKAESHITVRRLGRLSEMTSADEVRMSYIQDVFSEQFVAEGGKATKDLTRHPLNEAADLLLKKGLITGKQSQAMKLWGKLSYFEDEGLFIHTGNPKDSKFSDAIRNIRRTIAGEEHNIRKDIIEYVQDTKLRTVYKRPLQGVMNDVHPYVSIAKGMGALRDYGRVITGTVGNLFEETMYPFKRDPIKNFGIRGNLKYVLGGAAKLAAGVMALKTFDAFVATNPVFDGTGMEDGVGSFVAGQFVKGRLLTSRVMDGLGITGTAKYLNGLMPGFVTSAPGAVIGSVVSRTLGGGPLEMAKWFVGGALANRILSPLLPDFTKTYSQLKSEYSGEVEVPMMKNPMWLLGATPWQGSKVAGYQPNWFVRLQSRWKESDTLYGSAFRKLIHEPIWPLGINIGDFIDPYYNERCVVEDTPIITTNYEVKTAKNINIGDHVITSTGEFSSVIDKHTEYINESVIEINTSLFNQSYKTTKEHRYLAVKSSYCNQKCKIGRICYLKTWNRCKTCSKKYYIDYKKAWIKSDELKKGDFLVIPKIKIKSNDDHILFNFDKFKKKKKIQNRKNIPELFQKSLELFRLIGYFLAEGHTSKNSIRFDFHTDEITYHEDVCSIMNKLFNIKGTKYIDGNKTRLIFCNNLISQLFKDFFGKNCYEKKIPDCILNSSSELLEQLIIGAFRGDGCGKYNSHVRYDTVSQILATQIRYILLNLGYLSSFSITDRSQYREATIYSILVHGEKSNILKQLVGWTNINTKITPKKTYYEDENYFYIKILNVKESNYSGNIIDLKVKSGFSFCSYTAIFHNTHFFSRPFPKTGEFGAEIPLIGPPISSTIGRIIKPVKTMHQEFLNSADYNEESNQTFAMEPPNMREGSQMMHHTAGIRNMRGRSSFFGTYNYNESKMWSETAADKFLNNVTNFAGLPGFFGETIQSRLNPGPQVYPTLETAGRIVSQSRAYYDMNLGGLGIFSEAIRRLINKPSSDRYGVNPIPNLMADWLGPNLTTGDPYVKIQKGELRLPGEAYSHTHTDLKRDMPSRASMFGAPTGHMVQYFTGMLPPVLKEEYDMMNEGTSMHKVIQDQLAAENMLVQAEALVYDVKNDISGHVDAIIRDGVGGKGRKALEIKTINSEAFSSLSAPKSQHLSQLNLYLRQLKLKKGTILYVNRENPSQVKTYEVNYSSSRFERDVQRLRRARQISADMMQNDGIEDKYGYSYSWLDRMNILADVAPGGSEYKEAKTIVQYQMKYHKLSDKEIEKYHRIIQHQRSRQRSAELYPLRFKGKILSPDTTVNIQSINEDIKSGSEYALPMRALGSVWESFVNTNAFLTDKFFAFKDPIEHYKMLKLYGKEYTPWDEPYRSFIEPYTRRALSRTDPMSGALTWGSGGFIAFDGLGGLLGGTLGSIFGTVNGLIRSKTDQVYIPSEIRKQREIEDYFDQAKYLRGKQSAELSGGLAKEMYMAASDATLKAYNESGKDVANLFRGTGYMEKPYISSWINTTNKKEQKEILKFVPDNLKKALIKTWQKNEQNQGTEEYVKNISIPSEKSYRFDESVLDPSVVLDDIKLKTIEESGYESHDFGLGWNEQVLRIQNNYNDLQGVNITEENRNFSNDINPAQIKKSINDVFQSSNIRVLSRVYVNNWMDDANKLTIRIQRDSSQSIINALGNRERYNLDG